MNVSKHMSEDEKLKILNIHGDFNRHFCLFIGDHKDELDIYFKNLNHLKQFAEQLNAQIEELEK